MSARMCMQQVCEKRREHWESQRGGKPYPGSGDMWLSWEEEDTVCFTGQCFIWVCVCVQLLLDCAGKLSRICAPFLVSVRKHKFGFSNSSYGHQARDGLGNICDGNQQH